MKLWQQPKKLMIKGIAPMLRLRLPKSMKRVHLISEWLLLHILRRIYALVFFIYE
jgi:hypothetical protein